MTGNTYLSKKNRLLLSIAAAIYIVLYGRLHEIKVAVVTGRFYMALLISFLAALLIINMVQGIWIKIDHHYSERKYNWARLLLQIIFGITAPLLADLVCFALYFGIYGENIWSTGFLSDDFLYVFYQIAGLNLMYLYLSFTRQRQEYSTTTSDDNTLENEISQPGTSESTTEHLIINHNGTYVHLHSPDILYCYRLERNSGIVTHGKGSYSSNIPIANLYAKLRSSYIIQINRGFIINLTVVKGYNRGDRRDTLQLVIKKDFKEYFLGLKVNQYAVTRDHMQDFKRAFEAFQEEDHS